MHHLTIDSWSRRSSVVHQRDARSKLAALLLWLVVISTTPGGEFTRFALYAVILIGVAIGANLPVHRLLLRIALLLPFFGTFAVVLYATGQAPRAVALLEKATLCAFATLLFIASTPLNDILRAFEWFRAPRALLLTLQFLYRYLFVTAEQAQHMRIAARSRGAGSFGFRGASSAVAVLFLRSWQRAEGIYSAMLARGFSGHFPRMSPARFSQLDVMFLCFAAIGALGARFWR